MFRRRQPLTFLHWLRGLLWPRTGWRRAFVYYLKRLTRLSGTPHNIAAGFACGVAISFTPFVGFHILLGCLLALIVRGNFLAVVLGTLVGNPWTFPFLWVGSYEVGLFLLGGQGTGAPMPWTFGDLVGHLGEAVRVATAVGPVAMLKLLVADLSLVARPVMVGSVPLGIAAGLLTYFPLVRPIATYQAARRRRREQCRLREVADTRLKAAGVRGDAGTA